MEEDGAFDYGRSYYVYEHHGDHNRSAGGYIEEANGWVTMAMEDT